MGDGTWKVYDDDSGDEIAGGLNESEAMMTDGIYHRAKNKFYRLGLEQGLQIGLKEAQFIKKKKK